MIKKECKLTRAARYAMGGGGGGGGGSVMMRNPGTEKNTIGNWNLFQRSQLFDFRGNDPFLSIAGPRARDYFLSRLPEMTAQFPGFGTELQGYQKDLGGLTQQGQGLFGNLGDISKTLGGIYGGPAGPASIIASGGALTPGLSRDVSQQSRNIAAAQGAARGPGALGQELLNRDAYRQARLTQAQQMGQSLLGAQAGVQGQQGGILGLLSGLTGQQAGLTGERANLLGQEQALQTGGLNQLLGVGGAGVSQYGQLSNPVFGYLNSLFSGNQQASIAQAQIAAQQSAAGDAKTGSAVGGGIGAIGSIIGAL